MYAKFVACYEAMGQVNWLKKFIPGLKVIDNINEPLRLYCDNNPAVQYAYNNRSSGAAKHIDIKYRENARGSAHKGLTTQRVQRTRSRHGFKGKPMIPKHIKGPEESFIPKRRNVLWLLV
jgi:hypothetical protein